MNVLQPLHNRLDALIANLSPQKRSQLAREVGRELAKSQRQRITRQQNPDGSRYAPRKTPKRVKSKRGKIRTGAMFAKLKTTRLMRTKNTADGVEIGYQGQNAFIAEVHQYGKSARVQPKFNWKVKYEQRELLGFSESDVAMIEELVVKHLASQ